MKKLTLMLTVLLFSCASIFAQTITTSPVTISTKCAGDTIKVPYTISGTFLVGNTFTAQLSNAAGAFTSPVNIGTLTNTTVAGAIIATIPSGSASGTGYKIRVVSNSPVITGSTSTSTITINAKPATPTISSAARCGNGVLNLVATVGTNEVIKWFTTPTGATLATMGTATTSGSTITTPTSSLTATATYYALDSNTVTKCVAASRVAVTATINAVPAAAPASSFQNCGPGSLTITNTITPNATTNNWYDASTGGTLVQRNAINFTTPNLAATKIYYALDSNDVTGCVATTRSAVTVTINSIPTVTNPVNNAANPLCAGFGTQTLSVTATGTSLSYQWYKGTGISTDTLLTNSAPYTGATTATLTLTTPNELYKGNYYVNVKSSVGNCTVSSSVKNIVINPDPKVTITSSLSNTGFIPTTTSSVIFTATTTNVGQNVTYQWYKNGVSVVAASATAQTYTNAAWTASGGDNVYCVVRTTGTSPCGSVATINSNTIVLSVENTTGNTWQKKPNFAGANRKKLVGFSIGNKGYIGLGTNNEANGSGMSDFWEFDPELQIWTQKASFPGGPRYAAVGFSIAQMGYVGAGKNAGVDHNDFYQYNPLSNEWISKAPFGGGNRSASVAFSIGSVGYVACGMAGSTYKKDFWAYNSVTDIWEQKADYSGPAVAHPVGFSIENKGFVGSGYNAQGNSMVCWEYNPNNDGWTQKDNIPGDARQGMISFSIGNLGYVGAGYRGNKSNGYQFHNFNPTKTTGTQWTAISTFISQGNDNTPTVSHRYGYGFGIGNKGYVGLGDYESFTITTTNSTCWTSAPIPLPYACQLVYWNYTYPFNSNHWEYSPTATKIKTENPTNRTLCKTSTISIPFTIGNKQFNDGNIFKAELSDEFGSFANPVNISVPTASLSGSTIQGVLGIRSGNIAIAIPSNIAAGTQYRIRVVGSNPLTYGTMTDSAISIDELPSAGTIGTAHTVPFPAHLLKDSLVNITSPTTTKFIVLNYFWQRDTVEKNNGWKTIQDINTDKITFTTDNIYYKYRRGASFSCAAVNYTAPAFIKVFTTENVSTNVASLDGKISGKVLSRGTATGVKDCKIYLQKLVSLKGSPNTYIDSVVTDGAGNYTFNNVFYGDLNNGDQSVVKFKIWPAKQNHRIKTDDLWAGQNPTIAPVYGDSTYIDSLSVARKSVTLNSFQDWSTIPITGAVIQKCYDCITEASPNGGLASDSLNGITIKLLKNGNNILVDTTGISGYGKFGLTATDPNNYKVVPSKAGHKFTPAERSFYLEAAQANVDFVDDSTHFVKGQFLAGGKEYIGKVVLEFTDTVKGRPGYKFKKQVTSADSGRFSISLPPRTYRVKVISYEPVTNSVEFAQDPIIEDSIKRFFNVVYKDSMIVDIDTMSNTNFNLIYHRPVTLDIENLDDTCSSRLKVFYQNSWRKFNVKLYEGLPLHGVLVTNDSTQADTLQIITSIHKRDLAAGNVDTIPHPIYNGVDTISIIGGIPNLTEDHFKILRFLFHDKYGRVVDSTVPRIFVDGYKPNTGTFTTTSPQVPLVILHAPPGDQSSSTWEQSKTTETAISFTRETGVSAGLSAEVKISAGETVFVGAGIGAFSGTIESAGVWASASGSLLASTKWARSNESILSNTTTVSYSTEPGGGDVFVGAAINLNYAVANIVELKGCAINTREDFVVDPAGYATTYTYSEGQIKDVVMPTLRDMAANAPTIEQKKKYENQVSVWQQTLDNNNRNKANAAFVMNRSFDGNAGPITQTTSSSATSSNSISFDLDIEAELAISVGFELGPVEASLTRSIGFTMNYGSSSTFTNTKETTISYTLDDDDGGDYYSVDIKRDKVYNTPVFNMVAGTSSCPPEEIAQNRDLCVLDVAPMVNGLPNKVQRNIATNGEAIYQLKLKNFSESRETRTYSLEFDHSSNPDGAIVTIGGVPTVGALTYEIPYLGTQIVTVSVKKNPASTVYSYEGLKFILSDGCSDPEDAIDAENTISAFFTSACSEINMQQPTANWYVNSYNNNMLPIVFNGYNRNNLQSVTLEYAHVGRGDWEAGRVINQNGSSGTVIPLNLITNPNSTTVNWDITNVRDDNYEIRLKLTCSSGTTYTDRVVGVIDREAPSLFGTAQPTDHSYVRGDEMSFTFDENLNISAINADNIKLIEKITGEQIPVQVSVYQNKINIIPAINVFNYYMNDTMLLIAKNISDIYSNINTPHEDTIVFVVNNENENTTSNLFVNVSNKVPTKTSIYEGSRDSLAIKFKFTTRPYIANNTPISFMVSGSSVYNSGYTVSYSGGQNLNTVYTASEGIINIPAFNDSVILYIKPINDFVREDFETVTISLLTGGDYGLGSVYTITDTIKNDDYNTPIITASGGLCPGGSIILSTPNQVDDNTIASYQWKLNDTIIGTSTNTISVNRPGAYTVKITTADGFTGLSNVFNVATSVSPVSTTNMAICRGSLPYNWNGLTINAAGTYSITLTNSVGCDSIAKLVFTVKEPSASVEIIYADVAPYVWHGVEYYTSNDQATWTEVNAAGCDSVVTLNLTIANTCLNTRATFNVTACGFYIWHGIRFTSSQTLVWQGVNAGGCDSTETLNLTVKQPTSSTYRVSVCSNQMPFVYNGYTYTRAGTYSTRLTNVAGCDSIVRLIITLKSTTSSTSNVAVCSNQLPYLWNGINVASSGNYLVRLTNASGCDSMATLVFTVKNTTESTTAYEACNNQLPYVWNDITINEPGTYSALLTNAAECDSVATLLFSIKNTTSSLTNTTICSSEFPYSWNNQTITASGTYTATLTGSNGCDSVATLELAVNSSPIAQVIADGPTTFCPGGSVTLTAASQPAEASTLTLPLDINNTSVLAVGLRKLNSTYNGPIIRLRRTSDNEEQDFGAVGNNLDIDGINNWLQGTTGYCVTLFDQSGNAGTNVSQIDQNKQPVFVANGINNRPILHFNTSQYLFNDIDYPAPFSIVYGSRTTGFAKRVLSSMYNNWWLGYWDGKMDQAYYGDWVSSDNTDPVNNQFVIYGGTTDGSVGRLYKNGELITTANSYYSGPNGIKLNGGAYGGEESEVDFTDVLIYGSELPANQIAQLNQAISNYYVDMSGATYAWSTGETTPSIVATTTGNYSVSVTMPNGCSTTSTPVEVSAEPCYPKPTASLEGSVYTCSGSSVQLSINVTGEGPWTGTLSDGTNFEGAQSPILVSVSPSTNTTYTVAALSDIHGLAIESGLTGSATVSVNELPTPVINGNLSFCEGSSTVVGVFGSHPLVFNGSNQYGSMQDFGLGTNNFTIESWINPASYGSYIISNRSNNWAGDGYWWSIQLYDGKLRIENSYGSQGGDFHMCNATIPLNTWTHFAFVRNGTSVKLYLNGQLDSEFEDSYLRDYTNPYNIGHIGGWPEAMVAFYNGKMDQFRIWNTDRSQAEIQSFMNSMISSNTSGLKSNYSFNEADGNTSSDNGTFQNNATLYNGVGREEFSTSPVVSAISSVSIASYQWSNNATTPVISVNTPGEYTLTVTDANGCTATSPIVTIQSTPIPTAFAVTGGGIFCVGGNGHSIGLQGSEVGVVYQIKNNGESIGQPQEGTGEALDFGNYTNQGTYTIEATNITTSCTNMMSGSADIIVNILPNFAVTPTTINLCQGESAQITAEVSRNYCTPNNGYPYISYISEVHLNTLNSFVGSPQNQAHYNEPVGENTTTLVAGQSYEMTLQTAGNYSSNVSVWIDYNNNGLFEANEWVRPWSEGFSGSVMINVPSNAMSGLTRMRVRSNYFYSLYSENDACQNTDYGSTEDYMVNIEGGLSPETLQFTWNNGAFVGNTFVSTPTASTEYTVSTTSSTTGCTKTITIPVTVNALPVMPEIAANGPTSFCAGSSVTLNVQGTDGVIPPTVPVDEVNGATLAVGLRKLNSNYSGPALRLRRSSDNAEQDFGFDGNNLDVNAITTWLDGADGYCTTLYDQTNNGGNVTQAINDNQPVLVLSGINNKPVLHFNTTQFMFNQVNYPAPFTAIYGARYTGGEPSQRILSAVNNNWLLGYWGTRMDMAYFDGWLTSDPTPENSCNTDFSIYAGKSSGTIASLYKNGNLLESNNGGLTGPNGIELNGINTSGEFTNCDITDVIIYPTDLSTANIVALNNSIGQYYGSGMMNPISYTWSNGTTGSSLNVTASGTYSVTKTNLSGCSTTSEPIVVTVDPCYVKPTAQISGASTICAGFSTQLTMQFTGAGPWSGTLSDGTNFNSNENTLILTVSPLQTTTYTIVSLSDINLEAEENGLTGEAIVNVNTNTNQPVSIDANGPTTFCAGNSVILSGTDEGSNAVFVWSSGQTSSSISVNASGDYILYTSSDNGCSTSASQSVVVNPLPVPEISGNAILCQGSTSILDAGSGYSSYSWWNGETIGNDQTVIVDNWQRVILTVTNEYGCAGSDTMIISVNALPQVSASANTQTICSGQGVTLTVSSTPVEYCAPINFAGCGGDYISRVAIGSLDRTSACDNLGGDGYSYFGNENPTLTAGTQMPLSVHTGGDVEGIAVWIDYNQNGIFDASEVVSHGMQGIGGAQYNNVIDIPANAKNGETRMRIRCYYYADPSLYESCSYGGYGETEDYKVTIVNGASTNGITYQWTSNQFLSSSSNDVVEVAAVTETTNFVVTATDSYGCSSSASVWVNVNPLPTPVIDGQTSICVGTSTMLDAGESYSSYNWSTGETTSNINVSTEGAYAVNVTNEFGCSASSEPVLVSFKTKVTGQITGNQTICPRESADLYIDVTGDGPWFGTLSDGTNFSGSSSPIIVTVSPNATTFYSITSLNGDYCNANTEDMSGVATVVVRDVVSGSISGTLTSCNSEPVTININVTGDGPWYGTLSDGTTFSGNSSVIPVVVNPSSSTSYSISSMNGEYCIADVENLSGTSIVNVREIVSAVITGNATICNGYNTQLNIAVTGEGPWFGTLNNGMTFSGSISPILIQVSPTTSTNYSVVSLSGEYCAALQSNISGSAMVQVNNQTSSTTDVTICNNQLPYNWNNNNYEAAGTYSVTLTGSNGCDSVATLNLVVNAVTYSTTNMLLCSNQVPYVWNDISISNAGTYTKTLVNAMGCDSIATLNFSIKRVSSSTTMLTLCSNNLPLMWNGLSLTTSGTYTRSFNNSVGCDSLAIIILTVKQTSNIVDYVSAVGSYTWHGTTYTSSNNTATWTGVNAVGCDSTVRLDLTITYDCTDTDSTLNVTACKVYIWKGIRSTTSTTLEWIGVNAGGCDSVVTLNLTITTLAPTVAPASITQTLVSNVCGAKVYRYTAAPSVNASGYQWILPNTVGGVSGVFVDSGDINNSITIRVRYNSNNAAITGDSIKVKAFSVCGSTANRTVKLTNTLLTPPAAPASITATAISINTCGAKRYRYIAPSLPAATATAAVATGYVWSFKGTLGENAIIDSGDLGSRIITVTYSMNSAAVTGDSVKVAYTSVCGNSVAKALKLTNTLLSAPLAPSTVTITPVQTNVCGARKYRYSASALAAATTTAMPATGWLWSLPAEGIVGSTGTIDSGDVNSQTIIMKYTSNAAAAAGDTIRVAFTSACGLSVAKATKLTNTSIAAPLAPATVTVTPLVTNVCGARKYRYTAAGLVVSTTTATAATGWLWSLPAEGTVGSTGTLDSGEVNSQTIIMIYSSNAAAAAGDTIRVAYTSSCGLGAAKATKLTNTLLGAPLAPATVTIATVSDICGARVYRYTAPALPIATTTAGEAKGYLWSMPIGTLGVTGELDSGSLTSKVIRIRYSSNAAALTGDSIKVLYTSDCGNSPAKAQKLSNLAPTLLTAPATLTGTTSICSVVGTSTSNRYIATAVTGAVSYIWTLPAGAVLDSGSNGLKIKVRFLTAGANDSIYVQAIGTNGCAGTKKVLKLVTTGCVTQLISRTNVPSATKATIEPMQVNVYPNPSTSAFQMFVKTQTASKIAMRILDIQGRLIKTISFNSEETIAFGNDLKSGVYMVELREGNVIKTVRVVKY